jgi:hypothetical protein
VRFGIAGWLLRKQVWILVEELRQKAISVTKVAASEHDPRLSQEMARIPGRFGQGHVDESQRLWIVTGRRCCVRRAAQCILVRFVHAQGAKKRLMRLSELSELSGIAACEHCLFEVECTQQTAAGGRLHVQAAGLGRDGERVRKKALGLQYSPPVMEAQWMPWPLREATQHVILGRGQIAMLQFEVR